GDLDFREITASLLQLTLDDLKLLGYLLRRGGDGVIAGTVAGNAASGHLPLATHPDGDMRLLHWLGEGTHSTETVVSAFIAGGPFTGPYLDTDAHPLVGDAAPHWIVVAHAQRLELLGHPADAGPKDDAAVGEAVQGGQHLRQHQGIAVGDDQDTGAYT